MSAGPEPLEITTDVLVIGGGLAAGWAAAAAVQAGASVTIVDKGHMGTSGVTATAGPGHWWVPPDPPEARLKAIEARAAAGLGLAEPRWMLRVIEETWQHLPSLAGYYAFPKDARGVTQYRGLRGPEYMRALRQLCTDLGVRILDHSPALELLVDEQANVSGAKGIRRQDGMRPWTVQAGAVIMATGGCAFRSQLLGSHNNTGDGYLMAAEAGAELSGMEFSCYYTVAPAGTPMTRSMIYSYARYFDEAGQELEIKGPDQMRGLAAALLRGKVFCQLDRIPDDIRAILPTVQPNVTVSFDRLGIDPYTQRFEVTLHGEGTVRGIGGLAILGDDCATTVPGLYAAGDAATRELIAGAISGGGAQNSAWALSSGRFAGKGAASFASRRRRSKALRPAGRIGLMPETSARPFDLAGATRLIQGQMEAYDQNIFRTGAKLERSRQVLEEAWREASAHLLGEGRDLLATREVAAMLATARWCVGAALERRESRGMHQRLDQPGQDARYQHRLLTGGLHRTWTARLPAPAWEIAS